MSDMPSLELDGPEAVHARAVALFPTLIDAERRHVVHHVLANRVQLSPSLQTHMSQHLNRLQINGFKNGSSAPLPLQTDAFVKDMLRQPKLTVFMLWAWLDLHASLTKQIRALSRRHANFPLVFQTELKAEDSLGPVLQTETRALLDTVSLDDVFRAAFPDRAEFELVFTAFCDAKFVDRSQPDAFIPDTSILDTSILDTSEIDALIPDTFIPDEPFIRTSPQEGFSNMALFPFWTDWLAQLAALPATDVAWTQLKEFSAALERLAQEKRHAASTQAQLGVALATLQTTDRLLLEQLFALDVLTWETSATLSGEVESIVTQLEQLQVLVNRYHELEQKPERNLEERSSKRKQLAALEEEIAPLFTQLQLIFGYMETGSLKDKPETQTNSAPAHTENKLSSSVQVQYTESLPEIPATTEPNMTAEEAVDTWLPAHLEAVTLPAHSEGETYTVGWEDQAWNIVSPGRIDPVFEAGETSLLFTPRDKDAETDEWKDQAWRESTLETDVSEYAEHKDLDATTLALSRDLASDEEGSTTAWEEQRSKVNAPDVFAAMAEAAEIQRPTNSDDQDFVSRYDIARHGLDEDASMPTAVRKANAQSRDDPTRIEPSPHLLHPNTGRSEPLPPLVTTIPLVPPPALSAEQEENLFWQLLQEGDWSGAYWVAYSQEVNNVSPLLPSDLLAALQGAQWLRPETLNFADDLQIIAQRFQPDNTNLVQLLIGVASALRPTLFALSGGMIDWLRIPEQGWLDDLVKPIREFGFSGTALSIELIPGISQATGLHEELREVVEKTKLWWHNIAQRRTKLLRANEVWRSFIHDGGPMLRMLTPVLNHAPEQVEDVRALLEHWRTPTLVDREIDMMDRQLHGLGKKRIDGRIRDYLHRNIDTACNFAATWVKLVKMTQQLGDRRDWLEEQAQVLLHHFSQTLPVAAEELAALQTGAQLPAQRAAAAVLAAVLQELGQLFGLCTLTAQAAPRQESWMTLEAVDLQQALNQRLLLLPEVSLNDKGMPDPAEISSVPSALGLGQRDLAAIFTAWLVRQDYRFIDVILAWQDNRAAAEETFLLQREASRFALTKALEDVRNEIEQALVDGIITEAYRTEIMAVVDGIEIDATLNFASEFMRVDEIKDHLQRSRTARLHYLREMWEKLDVQIAQSSISESRHPQIRTLFDEAFGHQDARLVDESLAQLRRALETGSDLEDDGWFNRSTLVDEFKHFLKHLPEIERALENSRNGLRNAEDAIRAGQPFAGLNFEYTPRKRLIEAATALIAWSKIKKPDGRTFSPSQFLDHIRTLLTYLGFSLNAEQSLKIDSRGPDVTHMVATLEHGEQTRPIAKFGSQTAGQYHIVCLWDRPGMGTLASRLNELGLTASATIIFYLGRLTSRQRRDLVKITRSNSLPLVMLDELLLIYLATARDIRLPTFLRCTLPYATLSPYVLQAGNIPPEIFYGRREMIVALEAPYGPCIVYGGRQLGKSALLRQVQRLFHKPDRDEYIFLVDIKSIGDPLGIADTRQIWVEIREQLKNAKLLPDTISTSQSTLLTKHVLNLLTQRPATRLIFLFDESDHFLDADAYSEFQVVAGLRDLMMESDRRVKFVFVGLHNVQRFQSMPNQPLAHFGDAICVGPLEARPALELAVEALHVLGFRFADDKTPLRMLSYTNYHPALIQLFCQELLLRLQNRTITSDPPYIIQQNDVEAVYRNPEVRKRIRERFEWTLALDPRYQAIVYALVFDQIANHDSYAAIYSVPAILSLVQGWWKQGFKEVRQEQIQGYLDELVGLGILVRTSQERYRLRSPNLVRLLGTDEDIEAKLTELALRPARAEFSASYIHKLLDKRTQVFSPLSFAQERNLIGSASAVTLIFASEAQGSAQMSAAIRQFEHSAAGEIGCVVEPLSAVSFQPESFRAELQRIWTQHKDVERILVYCTVDGSAPLQAYTLVESANQFCRGLADPHRSQRVIFIFSAQATWLWLSTDPQRRSEIEANLSGVPLYPAQWSVEGVRHRMDQLGKIALPEAYEEVWAVTGGWPLLLDELFKRGRSDDDLRPLAQTFREELLHSNKPLSQAFRDALVAPMDHFPKLVLHAVIDLMQNSDDSVPEELIFESLVGVLESSPTLAKFNASVEYLVRMGCLRQNVSEVTVAPLLFDLLRHNT